MATQSTILAWRIREQKSLKATVHRSRKSRMTGDLAQMETGMSWNEGGLYETLTSVPELKSTKKKKKKTNDIIE